MIRILDKLLRGTVYYRFFKKTLRKLDIHQCPKCKRMMGELTGIPKKYRRSFTCMKCMEAYKLFEYPLEILSKAKVNTKTPRGKKTNNIQIL